MPDDYKDPRLNTMSKLHRKCGWVHVKLGSVLSKTFELLMRVLQTGLDKEKPINFALESFEGQRQLFINHLQEELSVWEELVLGLCDAAVAMIEGLMERRRDYWKRRVHPAEQDVIMLDDDGQEEMADVDNSARIEAVERLSLKAHEHGESAYRWIFTAIKRVMQYGIKDSQKIMHSLTLVAKFQEEDGNDEVPNLLNELIDGLISSVAITIEGLIEDGPAPQDHNELLVPNGGIPEAEVVTIDDSDDGGDEEADEDRDRSSSPLDDQETTPNSSHRARKPISQRPTKRPRASDRNDGNDEAEEGERVVSGPARDERKKVEKPIFECDKCDRIYRSKSTWTRHRRDVHGDRCSRCNIALLPDEMTRHMAKEHPARAVVMPAAVLPWTPSPTIDRGDKEADEESDRSSATTYGQETPNSSLRARTPICQTPPSSGDSSMDKEGPIRFDQTKSVSLKDSSDRSSQGKAKQGQSSGSSSSSVAKSTSNKRSLLTSPIEVIERESDAGKTSQSYEKEEQSTLSNSRPTKRPRTSDRNEGNDEAEEGERVVSGPAKDERNKVEVPTFECDKCDKVYRSKSAWTRHRRDAHGCRCSVCHIALLPDEMTRHMTKEHSALAAVMPTAVLPWSPSPTICVDDELPETGTPNGQIMSARRPTVVSPAVADDWYLSPTICVDDDPLETETHNVWRDTEATATMSPTPTNNRQIMSVRKVTIAPPNGTASLARQFVNFAGANGHFEALATRPAITTTTAQVSMFPRQPIDAHATGVVLLAARPPQPAARAVAAPGPVISALPNGEWKCDREGHDHFIFDTEEELNAHNIETGHIGSKGQSSASTSPRTSATSTDGADEMGA